jgi:hypothetical protein
MRGVREKVVNAERAIEQFKPQNDIFDADAISWSIGSWRARWKRWSSAAIRP